MEKAALLKLKQFLEDNICFYSLKKAGFWLPGTRKTDYERQAERMCYFFGYKSVYEYGKITCSVIKCYGVEGDPSGIASGGAELIRPNVDMSCPTNWSELPVPEAADLASNDKWLN